MFLITKLVSIENLTLLTKLINSHGKRYLFYILNTEVKNMIGLYQKYMDIDWTRVNRLVFICSGNICRSPYAQYKATSLGLNAISAGISVNKSTKADMHAIQHSSARNIDITTHNSISYSKVTYTESDLILCMEPYHMKYLINDTSVMKSSCQISLLGKWAEQDNIIIHDTHNEDSVIYNLSYSIIDSALEYIASQLLK